MKELFCVLVLALLGANLGTYIASSFGAPPFIDLVLGYIKNSGSSLTDFMQGFSAIFVAGVTYELWKVGRKQVEIVGNQANIAARQLEMQQVSERPYIFVSLQNPSIKYELDDGGCPVRYIRFRVSNLGRTPAVIDSIIEDSNFSKSDPIEPETEMPNHDTAAPLVLAFNERHEMRHYFHGMRWTEEFNDGPPRGDQEPDYYMPDIPSGEKMFLWILVRYHGIGTAGHSTSVCWRWLSTDNFSGFIPYDSRSNYFR